jgi:predicted enzyme related to lactoylglutathione lyase
MNVIQGLTKAILYVQDIDAQIKFYRDQLGLEVKSFMSIDERTDKQWVEFTTGECTLVLHGNMDKDFGKDRPKLAFRVDDFETAYNTLIERGVKLSPVRSPSHNLKVAEGVDPEGNPFTIDCQQ